MGGEWYELHRRYFFVGHIVCIVIFLLYGLVTDPSKKTLEMLREPIEDRRITVSGVNATLTFPSSIILVAVMNEVTPITIQCNEMRETPLCGVVGVFEEIYSICSKNMTLIY